MPSRQAGFDDPPAAESFAISTAPSSWVFLRPEERRRNLCLARVAKECTMVSARLAKSLPAPLAAFGLFLSAAAACPAQPCCSPTPRSVADLTGLGPEELTGLFANADLGRIPVGDLPGQVLYLSDKHGKFKVWASNLVWRG